MVSVVSYPLLDGAQLISESVFVFSVYVDGNLPARTYSGTYVCSYARTVTLECRWRWVEAGLRGGSRVALGWQSGGRGRGLRGDLTRSDGPFRPVKEVFGEVWRGRQGGGARAGAWEVPGGGHGKYTTRAYVRTYARTSEHTHVRT